MKKLIKNIIKGAGSTFDIAPAPTKTNLVRKHTVSVSCGLKKDWQAVGNSMQRAVELERRKDG